jgi:hypothetical protein
LPEQPVCFGEIPGAERGRGQRLIGRQAQGTGGAVRRERHGASLLRLALLGPRRTVPGTLELRREITERYLPPEQAEAYLKLAEAEFDDEIAIYLRPEHWLAADLGPG